MSELIEIDEFVYEIDSRIRELPDLKVENVRNMRKEFSKRLIKTSPQLVVSIAIHILRLDRPGFEYRLVAYELVTLRMG